MWPEAVDCLIAADRKRDAIDLIHEQLRRFQIEAEDQETDKNGSLKSSDNASGGANSKSSSVLQNDQPEQAEQLSVGTQCRLLCCLGDIAEDMCEETLQEYGLKSGGAAAYYEEAWELKRYTRAGRSLGFLYFRQALAQPLGPEDHRPQTSTTGGVGAGGSAAAVPQAASRGRAPLTKREILLEKAEQFFTQALRQNPAHPSCWFSLGCVQMRRRDYRLAASSFLRSGEFRHCNAESGEDEQGAECFGNLAACYSYLQDYKEARTAIAEACRRSMYNFRLWQSNLSIHLYLRDVAGCCRALRKLTVDLKKEIDTPVLGLLVQHVLDDEETGEIDTSCSQSHETASIKNEALPSVVDAQARSQQTVTVEEEIDEEVAALLEDQDFDFLNLNTSSSQGAISNLFTSTLPSTSTSTGDVGATSARYTAPSAATDTLVDHEQSKAKQAQQREAQVKRKREERKQLMDTIAELTKATPNVEATVWKILGLLQVGECLTREAFDTRMKEFRQLNSGLWMNVETQMVTLQKSKQKKETSGPGDTVFGRRLRELAENLAALSTLAPQGKDIRSLQFSVRNVMRKLSAKIDDTATVTSDWRSFMKQIYDDLAGTVMETLEARSKSLEAATSGGA
ncbi:unnamed protein product [Amoebophrya sp. A25]|nr:unnamed protein product [Amoebophrya sp. A25]|eukprot:GSA25T00002241001.1